MHEAAAIFAGGCLGALARVGLAEAAPHAAGQSPWTTFAANVAGAFLLGLVVQRFASEGVARPLLATGFCGALTTFSTLQIELLGMLDRGDLALAFAYALASIAAGLVAIEVGQRC